jgi:spermidine synthase
MLDKLPEFSCEENNIVFQQECEHYTITVCENDTYRWLTLGTDFIQSLISLSEHDCVLLPYTQSMLLALAFKQKPLRLLNLGAGCGTFERFLFKHYPDIAVTSVESSSDIINVSRKYFYIPPDHPVVNTSADLFLKNNTAKYDIIFIDVHDGSQHPEYFYDVGFYANAMNSLSEDGMLVMNIIPDDEKKMLDILLPMRKIFRWQYLLDFDNYKNVLLYVSPQKLLSIDANNASYEALQQHSSIDLINVIERLTLLPEAKVI